MFGIDTADRLTFATEEFANYLGMSASALTGEPFETIASGTETSDPIAVIDALKTEPAGTAHRCQVSWHDTRLTPVCKFTATESQRIIGTICESYEHFHELFEQNEDAMVSFELVDTAPIVRAVNDAFVETFGYTSEEMVGESLNDFIVPDKRTDEAADYDQRTADGETYRDTVTRKTVDGRRKFSFRSLSYEMYNGRRYGFAIYSDITDNQLRERELQVLHRVLRHNLRNDLSVIVGRADHIRESTDSADLTRHASRILAAAKRLNSVSEGARNVESALNRQSKDTIDAADVVRSVVAEYDGVQVNVPESAPVAGSTALYDAIDNLVENAVVHTPPETEVCVTIDTENGERFVRVSDNGPGIPEMERNAVFGDEPITTLKHGSGLGLWLARWVAQAAGGELRYDRFDGRTAVTMWLPRTDADTGDVVTSYRDDGPVTPD
jgi:PAS domain S-box-containing protein